jgi:hypothetical protein
MFGRALFGSLYHGFIAVRDPGVRLNSYDDPTLLRLFLNSTYLKAKYPRDYVFALVGLSHDCDHLTIEADYTLTIQQVYSFVFEHYIAKYKCVDFLCHDHEGKYYQCHTTQGIHFPTWLPSPEKCTVLFNYERVTSNVPRIPLSPYARIDWAKEILSVQGFKWNTVVGTTTVCPSHDPISVVLRQLQSLSAFLASFQLANSFAALACSWVSNQSCEGLFGQAKPTDKELQEQFDDLCEYLRKAKLLDHTTDHIAMKFPVSSSSNSGFSAEHRMLARMIRCGTKEGILFRTGQSMLGLYHLYYQGCPVRSGDEIWVLFGCSMPIGLRPTGSTDAREFKCIGAACGLARYMGSYG